MVKSGQEGSGLSGNPVGFPVTVNGYCDQVTGLLATASVVTVWDGTNHFPTTVTYFHVNVDQVGYLQVLTSGTNFILPLVAGVPLVLAGSTALAAADATLITGGVEPTLASIAELVLGNYSGGSMNYVVSVIN